MRRRIVSVLLVLLLLLLVLNSCKVEVLRNGENINNMLYPYLEFTLSEDGSYYTAEIIENVRLEEVEIPEAIDNLGTSIPVLYFAGFKNAKDSLFLKRVVLETSKTIIKKEALKSAQNFNKLEIKKIEGNTTIPELPTIEKEGKEFLGWFIFGSNIKVSSGEYINFSSLLLEPRWKENNPTEDNKNPTGGFDIKAETKEPRGKIKITKDDDEYRASFILDSDSKMTAIKWFVDNTEIAQTNECSFSISDSRSYNILCVVFNGTLVNSYSTVVIGSSK